MTTPDQYFFLDEEQQKPLLSQCGQRMAPIIGGQLKWRSEGDELHVTGLFQGRPARIMLSVSFGSVDLELKMAPPRSLPQSLYVHVDPDAKNHAGEALDRDEWDDEDGTSQKLFLAPHIYLEGDADELQTMHGMFGRLSQPGQNALMGVLSTYDRGSFYADGNTLKLSAPSKVTLDGNVAQLVGYCFNMLLLLSNEMTQVWR